MLSDLLPDAQLLYRVSESVEARRVRLMSTLKEAQRREEQNREKEIKLALEEVAVQTTIEVFRYSERVKCKPTQQREAARESKRKEPLDSGTAEDEPPTKKATTSTKNKSDKVANAQIEIAQIEPSIRPRPTGLILTQQRETRSGSKRKELLDSGMAAEDEPPTKKATTSKKSKSDKVKDAQIEPSIRPRPTGLILTQQRETRSGSKRKELLDSGMAAEDEPPTKKATTSKKSKSDKVKDAQIEPSIRPRSARTAPNLTCDIEDCGKTFKKAYYLVKHKRETHFPEESYLCLWNSCTFTSFYKRSIVRHLFGKHKLDDESPKEEIAALVGTVPLTDASGDDPAETSNPIPAEEDEEPAMASAVTEPTEGQEKIKKEIPSTSVTYFASQLRHKRLPATSPIQWVLFFKCNWPDCTFEHFNEEKAREHVYTQHLNLRPYTRPYDVEKADTFLSAKEKFV